MAPLIEAQLNTWRGFVTVCFEEAAILYVLGFVKRRNRSPKPLARLKHSLTILETKKIIDYARFRIES